MHILKTQTALLPLYTTNQALISERAKSQQLQNLLQQYGANSQIKNYGTQTAQEWHDGLAKDVTEDTIVPKLAELPILSENLKFLGIPEQYITDTNSGDVDNSDHNFVTICQIRGDRKIYLKLEKLSQNPAWVNKKPLIFTPLTLEKMKDDDDHLHNFSHIADQFLDWGKQLTYENLENNSWIKLLLHNVKFEQREHQQDAYIVILKAGYCLTDIADQTPYETLVKAKGLIPAALVYLFYNDTGICYHRYLHRATDQDKFERSFTKLKTTNL